MNKGTTMKKCCDNPSPGYGAPLPDGDGTTDAICVNCGHSHGKMTPEKAAELFKKFETEPKPEETNDE